MAARSKPNSCIGCVCHDMGTDFSAIEGTGSSGIMLVGEASGEHEQRDGLPFRPHAPAGGVLERTLRRMGLDRQQFSITNVVRCRPRKNWLEGSPWEFSAINHCRPNLDAAIAERRPRVIVALGGTALRELTGMAGEAQGISHLAGYVLPLAIPTMIPCSEPAELDGKHHPNCFICGGSGFIGGRGAGTIPVIGDFHPSFLRHGKMALGGVFARILQRATNIAKGLDREWLWGVDPRDHSTWGKKQYVIHPSVDDARALRNRVYDNQNIPVAEDIETPESASMDEDARDGYKDTEIRQIQFSMGKGEGMAFPWEEPFRSIASEIMHSPNPKYGHNWDNYDHKVLRAAAAREGWSYAPTVRVLDTLDLFHHWQPDLPAHLQFACNFISFPFPWKHLHTLENEPFYGCVDVDSDWQLGEMLIRTLKRDDMYGFAQSSIGYIGQVYEVRPVLAAMEDRGMPIDDAARLALDVEFEIAQRELGTELAKLAPRQCGRLQPKEGYKGVPPEMKPWINTPQLQEEMDRPRLDDREYYHYAIYDFPVAIRGANDELAIEKVDRWVRVYDFNPNSRPQIINYMKAKGHPVPKSKEEDSEGNAKETTAAKELMRLAAKTGDDFYLKCNQYKGYTKMRGTYVAGFIPGEDGCVHTTFTFDTGIGQLSSRNPNIQNFPKLKPTPAIAKSMRKMVAAKPGHVLTEWDFKSCHVITLGFLAEDLNYMRLGRLDIHSFVAGHFLGHWDGLKIFGETDEELLARFKWLKSDEVRRTVRDDQAKHGILGIGNGLKAKGLYERYMESFPPTPCQVCAGTGKVAGVRGPKKCASCQGIGKVPGQRVAERVLEVCESLFPNVFAYQKREVKQAHEQQFLKTDFGHIRRFYEVFRWDHRRGDWGPGDQHEEAVAFRLANIAFGHIREKLKQLHYSGLAERWGLFNNVHDSFLFNFPESQLEEHVAEVYPVLVEPSKVLRHPTICPDGLVIGVEGAWGRTWADMQEIKVGVSAASSSHEPEVSRDAHTSQSADLATARMGTDRGTL